MFSDQDIELEIQSYQEQLDALEERRSSIVAAKGHLEALREERRKIADLARQELAVFIQTETEAVTASSDVRKPDVQVLEEILRDRGPLHISDIVKEAQAKGISLAGSKSPPLLLRDKLNNSKRFNLFGNNVWGLPGQDPEAVTVNTQQPIPNGIGGYGGRGGYGATNDDIDDLPF